MEVNKEYRMRYNFLLNCAKQSSEAANRLRGKVEEMEEDIKTLDGVEEYLLEKIKDLTGKDLRSFAMDNNYGKRGK
jgi:chaperonin cofactor prefoldin